MIQRIMLAFGFAIFFGLANPASASLDIVNYQSDVGVKGTPGSISLTWSPAPGNLLLVFVCTNWEAGAYAVGDQWTQVGQAKEPNSNNVSTVLLYHYVQSGDTETLPPLMSSGSTYWAYSIYEISGVTGDAAKDFQAMSGNVYYHATSGVAYQQTTNTANTLALVGGCKYDADTLPSFTSPGWTTAESGYNYGAYGSWISGYLAVPAANTPVQASINFDDSDAPTGSVQVILQHHTYASPFVRNVQQDTGDLWSAPSLYFAQTPMVGDLLIGCINWSNGTVPAPTPGLGWTAFQNAGSNTIVDCMYHYVQSGDTSFINLSPDSSYWGTDVYEIGGVSGIFSKDLAVSEGAYQATGSSQITTSEATSKPNSLAIIDCGNYDSGTPVTVSNPWQIDAAFAGDTSYWGAWVGTSQIFASTGSLVSASCTYGTDGEPSGYVQMIFNNNSSIGGGSRYRKHQRSRNGSRIPQGWLHG